MIRLTPGGVLEQEKMIFVSFDLVNVSHQGRGAMIHVPRMPLPHQVPLLELLSGRQGLLQAHSLDLETLVENLSRRWFSAEIFSPAGFPVCGIERITGIVK